MAEPTLPKHTPIKPSSLATSTPRKSQPTMEMDISGVSEGTPPPVAVCPLEEELESLPIESLPLKELPESLSWWDASYDLHQGYVRKAHQEGGDVNVLVYDLTKEKSGVYRAVISDLYETSTNVFFTGNIDRVWLTSIHISILFDLICLG